MNLPALSLQVVAVILETLNTLQATAVPIIRGQQPSGPLPGAVQSLIVTFGMIARSPDKSKIGCVVGGWMGAGVAVCMECFTLKHLDTALSPCHNTRGGKCQYARCIRHFIPMP